MAEKEARVTKGFCLNGRFINDENRKEIIPRRILRGFSVNKIKQPTSSVMEILQLLSKEYVWQAKKNLSDNISNIVTFQTY